ncbi:MAG TPA: TolC family protein [Gemmatimonadales bacterium]|jgi:outer membrane protein, multidrug efflux system|nr:TolC family protein [Gemmatimonadales bacterium]
MIALLLLATFQAPLEPDTLTLAMSEAVHRALAASPSIASAASDVTRTRGLRAETLFPFPSNPVAVYGRTTRTTPSTTTQDTDWLVSQEIEIGGQSFTRRAAMSAFLRASEARVEDAQRLTALEARQAYLALALAHRQEALIDTTAGFAERMAGFAKRQFEAGEINRLELNAAVLDAARTRSAAERARAVTETAAADLARLLSVPADTVVRTGPLPPLPRVAWDSAARDPISLARSRRPDLLAVEADVEGAGKALSAAQRAFIPNLTVAAVGGQESGTDDLLGLQFGLQVPLFYNGQAARGAAEADLAASRAARAATTREIQAELQGGLARLRRSTAAERHFAGAVVASAAENVALTERALVEGEVDLTDVIVLRRAALEAQLEYLAVLADAYSAWFEVSAALDVDPLELAPLLTGKPEP